MPTNRRKFIRQFGIVLAGLLSARCAPKGTVSCYAPMPPTATPGGNASGGRLTPEQARLRACWLALDTLAEQTQKDSDRGMQVSQELVEEHRAALDALIETSELDAEVADLVHLAFQEAAGHIWATYAPILCYKETPLNYRPASCDDLVRRAELLAESGDLAAETVALAQTAIARDMAFLGLSEDETRALYGKITQGSAPETPYPNFDEIEFAIPPEAKQAARFLVELLLEK